MKLIWISRVLFPGLALFELLAWAKLIPVPPPDFTWLGLVGTSLAVWLFVELTHLPGWLRLLVWLATFSDAMIDSFHIYSRWHPSDRIMHFTGGFISALIAFYLFDRWLTANGTTFRKKLFIVSLFAIFAASFVGLIYEGWEFFIDLTYVKASKSLGDGRDTVDDQLLGLGGAIVAVSLSGAAARKRTGK